MFQKAIDVAITHQGGPFSKGEILEQLASRHSRIDVPSVTNEQGSLVERVNPTGALLKVNMDGLFYSLLDHLTFYAGRMGLISDNREITDFEPQSAPNFSARIVKSDGGYVWQYNST
jgi:hypothetical protein|tara:strand:- start:1439 stop:1789 length:351 start_codon:yes stop_codon:yes gene_type:complete